MEMRNAYKIVVGEAEGKSRLRRWEENTRMNLREMERCGLDSSGSE
jgi:hypothetical protein